MKASEFKRDVVVWLPCDVRSGPFSNERRIFVKIGESEWFGFVDIAELKESDGKTFVRAVVLAVRPDAVVLGIRGQSPGSGPIQAKPSLIIEHGAFAI